MRFLIYEQLRMEKGIPYSDRQLKRLEAKGDSRSASRSPADQSKVGPSASSISTLKRWPICRGLRDDAISSTHATLCAPARRRTASRHWRR